MFWMHWHVEEWEVNETRGVSLQNAIFVVLNHWNVSVQSACGTGIAAKNHVINLLYCHWLMEYITDDESLDDWF